MLSIAEYAKTRGISQTAIRRQLTRYQEELQGHITIHNRKKMLDDTAVDFLDSHRMQREIIIEQADTELKKELEDLRARMDLMKDQVRVLQEKIIDLQDQKMEYIADQTRNQLLLEMKDQEAADLQARLDEAEKEVGRYTKTWFGLYRKKED